MTDKEKMINGLPYRADGDGLFKDRQQTKIVLQQYNQLFPTKIRERNRMLKTLFSGTGQRLFIEPPFFCDYGYNIQVGENFYANCNLTILDSARVEIGDNVMIAPNVSIFTAGHPLDPELRIQGWEFAFPVLIGHNVWIGGHSVINPGITIGDNSVIVSGSVVTRDIPPNVIAVGNPCRVLREIQQKDKEYYAKGRRYEFD